MILSLFFLQNQLGFDHLSKHQKYTNKKIVKLYKLDLWIKIVQYEKGQPNRTIEITPLQNQTYRNRYRCNSSTKFPLRYSQWLVKIAILVSNALPIDSQEHNDTVVNHRLSISNLQWTRLQLCNWIIIWQLMWIRIHIEETIQESYQVISIHLVLSVFQKQQKICLQNLNEITYLFEITVCINFQFCLPIIITAMQESTIPSLQDLFQQLLPLISLQGTNHYLQGHESSTQQSSAQEQLREVSLQLQMIKTCRLPLTLMAELQTKDVLILAFSSEKDNKSSVTLQLVNKIMGETKEIPFKALEVSISSMALKLNYYQQIQLIVGTKCGRLFVYRNLQKFQAYVTCFRIQACSVLSIEATHIQNIVFVLSESSAIYILDVNDFTIKQQFKYIVPTIKDIQIKLLIESNYKYLCCCFSYGLILVWAIPVESFEPKKGQTKKMFKKHSKQIVRKNVSLKPKTKFISGFLEGIFWIDLFGEFLIVLTFGGCLKIVAVNFGQNGFRNMLQTVINEIKVCEPIDFNNGKHINKQNIIGVQKLNFNQIFISKSMDLPSFNVIEQYQIKKSYKIIKKLVINLQTSRVFREIRLTNNWQLILCRSDKDFSISKLKEAKKIPKQRNRAQ